MIADGFSEAAADTFYSSLAQLNDESGGKIFQSPIHLIGHSRGTVVNMPIGNKPVAPVSTTIASATAGPDLGWANDPSE